MQAASAGPLGTRTAHLSRRPRHEDTILESRRGGGDDSGGVQLWARMEGRGPVVAAQTQCAQGLTLLGEDFREAPVRRFRPAIAR